MSNATTTSLRPLVGMYAFHSADPRRLAAFWSELMELPVSEHSTDELVMLDFDHAVGPQTWMFHHQADAGTHPSRVAFDLGSEVTDGWRALADRAEALGATGRAEFSAPVPAGLVRWIELVDPDGNPFRIFAPRPGE